MCGVLIVSNKDSNESTIQALKSISYRGLEGYNGYQHWKGYDMVHQALPMINPDPEKVIQPIQNHRWDPPSLFVGEIFNWMDFDYEEAYDFDGHMLHTLYKENLQHLKLEETHDMFHQFDGFWSFVTFVEDHPIAYTDFLGIKPVYYRTDMTAIASEPDVLKRFGEVTPNRFFLSNVMKW